jgi:hypothetical protein
MYILELLAVDIHKLAISTILLPAEFQGNYSFSLNAKIRVHERLFLETTSGADDL